MNRFRSAQNDNTAFIAVAGGVNIDIGGISFAPLLPKDSNPGCVTLSLGGVGRNIAQNLTLLGVSVKLFTGIGTDFYGEKVKSACREDGIDLHAHEMPDAATSTYLYVADADGDMALAVSDMEICNRLTPTLFEGWLPVINRARALVVDANLPEETLVFLSENVTVPIFADPVSVAKAPRLKPVLNNLHTLKPNRMEAELLSGVAITDDATLEQAAYALTAKGVKHVCISLGEAGVFFTDGTTKRKMKPAPAEVKSMTGAGDAFMAGLVYGYFNNFDAEASARVALAAASIAIESKETINERLSPGLLRRKAKELT